MIVHPEFFAVTERVRRNLEAKGMRGSQKTVTQILAKKLKFKRGLYDEFKKVKIRKKS